MIEKEGFNLFIKEYSKISKISTERAEKLTKNFIEAIKKTLIKYDIEILRLRNLGAFMVYERAERSGTLFGEKKVVTFPAKKTIKFKITRTVKEELENCIKEREEKIKRKNGGVS